VTNTPTPTGLSVSVSATGTGNALQRITFGALRNGVIDVAGVVTGAGSGYVYAVPSGATQASFTVRATDASQVVQIPLTVTDGCGDWRTFVGTGAGALQNPAIVCTSGETVLSADAPIGTSALQVSNQGCFKIGDQIRLDPGGPTDEVLEVAGFGSVLTKTPTQAAHAAGTRARRIPDSEKVCTRSGGCSNPGESCCTAGAPFGRCCSPERCCPDGCCSGVYNLCCSGDGSGAAACIDSTNPADCCAQGGVCPSGSPAGSRCCDFGDGGGFKCHTGSEFQTSVANCGSCGNDCRMLVNGGDNCSGGQCKCGSGAACDPGDECIRGVCCRSPNQGCGPSTNRQCCNAQVAYCTTSAAAPGGICCNNNRWACGTACCAVGSRCLDASASKCVSCGCGGDNSDGKNKKCLCGNGPTCDASQGQECRNGACTCAAHPGNKLAFFSCDYNPSIGAYDRILYECDNSYQSVCKKIDGSPDSAARPPYSCTTSPVCSDGYINIDPICTS
jgi:hypothetical protein